MIWSDKDEKYDLELEVELRDQTHQCEVSRIHQNIEVDKEEGFWYPISYTYEFKIFAWNDLTGDCDVPVTDLTEQENFDLQKYIDEYAADQAASAAESRYDR